MAESRENWKEKYRIESMRWNDERMRMMTKIGRLERHAHVLIEIIERMMDPNRTFRG